MNDHSEAAKQPRKNRPSHASINLWNHAFDTQWKKPSYTISVHNIFIKARGDLTSCWQPGSSGLEICIVGWIGNHRAFFAASKCIGARLVGLWNTAAKPTKGMSPLFHTRMWTSWKAERPQWKKWIWGNERKWKKWKRTQKKSQEKNRLLSRKGTNKRGSDEASSEMSDAMCESRGKVVAHDITVWGLSMLKRARMLKIVLQNQDIHRSLHPISYVCGFSTWCGWCHTRCLGAAVQTQECSQCRQWLSFICVSECLDAVRGHE